MATSRPVVSVYKDDNPGEKAGTLPMPAVLMSPLRPDLVRYIHMNVSKNKRQAQAVGAKVGYDTAAESWGTGRAVARVPRAPGGGTHRAGQGAFGNMCRGGRMFAPTRTWRKWHRKINVNQRRYATTSALAASAVPALVMARGHAIDTVDEIPLVVDGIEAVAKTKDALAALAKFGADADVKKAADSKKLRVGKGKMRNRRYVMRKGPLVVYAEDNGIVKAFRNIPGVQTACVTKLNLLTLAPGGHFGRFLIWTESAFKYLSKMYGTLKSGAPLKRGYTLPRAQMENADVARIINSTEVQSVLRPKLEPPKKAPMKKNPLKSFEAMEKLNPYAPEKKALERKRREKGSAEQKEMEAKVKARKAASKEYNKKQKRGPDTFYKTLMKAFEAKAKAAKKDEAEGEEEAEEE
mmetsp:Transcript_115277/g.320592  ORF Transcript_115277/g.320592 Transcript_115277/m.320592 type:complete len:408 (+) Transcript_115277:57-1280(+)